MSRSKSITNVEQERALLVQVIAGKRRKEEAADSLGELERLADTAKGRGQLKR